ncbi:MAG TPA: hypothetical protein PLC20_14440, partial [Flavobacteriales bacterium]|nr:hypothetical protein [Flavobacteriales bacterium]
MKKLFIREQGLTDLSGVIHNEILYSCTSDTLGDPPITRRFFFGGPIPDGVIPRHAFRRNPEEIHMTRKLASVGPLVLALSLL